MIKKGKEKGPWNKKDNWTKKKEKGRKDKEKETQEYDIQIKVKRVNGIKN